MEIFSSLFNFLNYLLNFPMRMEIIQSYEEDFTTMDWVLLLVANIALLVLLVVLLILLVKLVRRIFRFRIPVKEYENMAKQVNQLQRDLIRANYEKDKLLSMRVAELGGDPAQAYKELMEGLNPEKDDELPVDDEIEPQMELGLSNRNTFESPCVDPSASRFFRLTGVDNYYKKNYKTI